MSESKIDVRGETCPVPLVEVRKALKKAKEGDLIEVIGDNPASKKEIPMVAKALKVAIVSADVDDIVWKFVLKK